MMMMIDDDDDDDDDDDSIRYHGSVGPRQHARHIAPLSGACAGRPPPLQFPPHGAKLREASPAGGLHTFVVAGFEEYQGTLSSISQLVVPFFVFWRL